MNLSQFFDHWRIVENPFRGEEARNDAVFVRMTGSGGLRGTGAMRVDLQTDTLAFPPPSHPLASFHSDFDKVLGDLHRPQEQHGALAAAELRGQGQAHAGEDAGADLPDDGEAGGSLAEVTKSRRDEETKWRSEESEFARLSGVCCVGFSRCLMPDA